MLTRYENYHRQGLETDRYCLSFKISCDLPRRYIKTTGIIMNIEHQIPAPVEAVLDKLFELSIAKLAISRLNIINMNKSINDANTNVNTEGHTIRQSTSFGDNRRRIGTIFG